MSRRRTVRSPRAPRSPHLAVACLLAFGCGEAPPTDSDGDGDDPGPDPDPSVDLALVPIADGLDRPVHLTTPSGDPRLFVVEKTGRILIVEDGGVRATPFLDLSGSVSGGNEQGLLSMAFHPDYSANGRFFVNYTDTSGDTRVVRYRVSADPNEADAASASIVLSVDQPFANHNGGHLLFGPDGRLYVPLGDGGSAGDPAGNGQDATTLLGAVLRLDVDGGEPYAVPPDNPFADHPSFRPEIWLTGVRNPWRIAFDEEAGDLYVADVGQSRWEEVTVVEPGGEGANLGWNVTEGTRCFQDPDCMPENFTLPQLEYPHADGCSITGGDVYRGSVDAIRGAYFYADYCSGWIRSFRYAGGIATEMTEWDVGSVGNITSFGEDAAGELYVLTEEAVYRLEEETP